MQQDIDISVIIPAYNEAQRIGPTLQSLGDYFAARLYSYEIIVVNDGSSDDTASVVNACARSIPHIILIDNELNQGKGHVVRQGMLIARGTWRLFMDADNSVTIDHLHLFLTYARKGNDIVIGSIAHPSGNKKTVEHNGWHRRVFGSISKFLIRVIATPGIYDTQRGFKLFSGQAAEVIFRRQTIKRFGFDIELLVIAQSNGYRIKELPVTWDNPDNSTVRLSDYFRTFNELYYIVRNRLGNAYGEIKKPVAN